MSFLNKNAFASPNALILKYFKLKVNTVVVVFATVYLILNYNNITNVNSKRSSLKCVFVTGAKNILCYYAIMVTCN